MRENQELSLVSRRLDAHCVLTKQGILNDAEYLNKTLPIVSTSIAPWEVVRISFP
jgi:hypothetical protein